MPDIYHEIVIAAPAEKVYQALTNQETLSAWWTPSVIAKPEIDSISRFTFGSNYFKEMKVVELNPGKLVKWLCISGADEWVGTSITFRLENGTKAELLKTHPEAQDQIQQKISEGGMLLTLQHEKWKAYSPMFGECNYTWAMFLKSLQSLCETGKGFPWPEQHREHDK